MTQGKMNRSMLDAGGAAIVVSQFTLYADTRKGSRPPLPMRPAGDARRAVERFAVAARAGRAHPDRRVRRPYAGGDRNDGPVTILMEM